MADTNHPVNPNCADFPHDAIRINTKIVENKIPLIPDVAATDVAVVKSEAPVIKNNSINALNKHISGNLFT
jgi:hypothetical protein